MELYDVTLNDLYARIRKDDMQAFETLYRLMYKRLYSVANMILDYKELNEEVVEEVFTSFWVNRKKVEIGNIFTYLYVLTKNKAIDTGRKENRWGNFSIEDVNECLLQTTITPESAVISKEEINKINQLVKSLPKKRRTVLLLVKYHGLKNKEVAEILGISIKTVDNHLAAAIKFLIQALEKQGITANSRQKILSWLL